MTRLVLSSAIHQDGTIACARSDDMTIGNGDTVGTARTLEMFVGVHHDRLIGCGHC